MKRLEAFAEMQKDNSKRFSCNGNEYFVAYDSIYVKLIGEGDSKGERVSAIGFELIEEYIEITQPLWEVIEEMDEYYIPSISSENYYHNAIFYHGNEMDNRRKNRHLMFRSKEEAIEVAKKMLEVIK